MFRYFTLSFIFISFSVKSQFLQDTIRFIALGDSYTIGQSVDESDRWPNQFIDSLSELNLEIEKNITLATTGWTSGNLLQALSETSLKKDFNLVSILIGVNNFYQNQPIENFRLELSNIIDFALTLTNQDTNGLFLITIPDYGYTPFGENQQEIISEKTNLYNQIKDSTAKEYGIPLINITPISRNGIINNNLVASDGLHPSKKQYALWVDLIIKELTNDFQTRTLELKNKEDYILSQLGNELKLSSYKDGFCDVYDFSGRRIKRSNLNSRFTLYSGAFLLKIVIGGKTAIHKIIVSN